MNELEQLADRLEELAGLHATFSFRRGNTTIDIELNVYEEDEDESDDR